MSVEAYEPPDPNEWVRPIALGVTVILIAWNITGYIKGLGFNFEGVFLSLITTSFALLSFNASAQMRRAAAKVPTTSVKRAHKYWTGALMLCSLWCAGSAHHAYGVIIAKEVEWSWSIDSLLAALQAAPLLVALTIAAFIEPFLPWAIETVEAAPKAVAVQEPAPAPKPEPSRASDADAKRLASELNRMAPTRSGKQRSRAAAHRAPHRPPALTETDLRGAMEALTKRGEVISYRKVAAELKVSPSRVLRSPHYGPLAKVA